MTVVVEFLEQKFEIPNNFRTGIGPTSGLSYGDCLWRRYMLFWHKQLADQGDPMCLKGHCTDQGFDFDESVKCAKLLTAMAYSSDRFTLQMCKDYADQLMFE